MTIQTVISLQCLTAYIRPWSRIMSQTLCNFCWLPLGFTFILSSNTFKNSALHLSASTAKEPTLIRASKERGYLRAEVHKTPAPYLIRLPSPSVNPSHAHTPQVQMEPDTDQHLPCNLHEHKKD
jgi:hypothetical protein